MNNTFRLLLLLGLGLSVAQGEERTPIAVADFGADGDSQLSQTVPDLLAERLINTGRFDVYERAKLRNLFQEQEFQVSGLANPDTAVTWGKLAGVPYILTGNIETGSDSRAFSGFGVSTRSTVHHLHANMRIVDVASGRVLFTRNESAEETVQNQRGSRDGSAVHLRLARRIADRFIEELNRSDLFVESVAEKPEKVTIRIDSEPSAADVEIAGVYYGNAGKDFEVPVGIQQIDVSLPGYHAWSKKVDVQEGLSFKANLTRKSDLRIEIDDNE